MTAKTKDVREIKTENKIAVYEYILRHESSTKQELFAALGLSMPTIKLCLEYLQEMGLISASDIIHNTGGRNATAYRIVPDGRFAAGLFLSPNHITALCLDLSGKVLVSLRKRSVLAAHDDAYLKEIGDMTQEVIRMTKLPMKKFLGVGISVPSLVSADGEQMVHILNRNYRGITREMLSKYLPWKTRMYHDSYAAGFAEVWGTRNIRNAVYLNLNDSIGGSVLIDGRVFDGDDCRAGEIGHMIIHPKDGKRCYCGQYGCLDTCCNAAVLSSMTDGNLEAYFRLLSEGNEQAAALWETYTDDLALGIHNLRMISDSKIIIGGYVGAQIGPYLNSLYAKIDHLSIFGEPASSFVEACHYKRESTAAGAALGIVEEYIHSI